MKKNCAQIIELLKSGLLDNEIEPAGREEVNLHLAACAACRSAAKNLAAISSALRGACRVNPPGTIWPRIQAGIAQSPSARLGPSGIFSGEHFRYLLAKKQAFAFAAAAALVIAAAGLYLGSGSVNNGEHLPSLAVLAGNEEINEPNVNFGSSIEIFFL